MTPTFTCKSTTVTYRVDIDRAGPLRLYPRGSTAFRPASAEVSFASDGRVSVRLFGPNVKRDGTVGQRSHDKSLWDKNDRPDWYDALIDFLRPAAEQAFR